MVEPPTSASTGSACAAPGSGRRPAWCADGLAAGAAHRRAERHLPGGQGRARRRALRAPAARRPAHADRRPSSRHRAVRRPAARPEDLAHPYLGPVATIFAAGTGARPSTARASWSTAAPTRCSARPRREEHDRRGTRRRRRADRRRRQCSSWTRPALYRGPRSVDLAAEPLPEHLRDPARLRGCWAAHDTGSRCRISRRR